MRIAPVEPPYDATSAELLEGMAPIALFRTFARNPGMLGAMRGWGGYTLGRGLSLSLRQREIVIDRTTARCDCEYEWGVHVAYFKEKADLDHEQIVSLTHGTADDPCWSEAESTIIRAVDRLHEHSDLDDELWAELTKHHTAEQLLDLMILTGWYHAISYAANGARVPLEPGAPRFADYGGGVRSTVQVGVVRDQEKDELSPPTEPVSGSSTAGCEPR